jgi:hypothetical protein
LFAGCCVHGRLIDQDGFAQSTLEEKISHYENAIRRKCVTNDMLQLLRKIAAHGEPAADAMAELFREPNRYFPLEHAMIVFEFTRFEGVDLLQHEGMAELRRLAESHPDQRIRELAQSTIEEIKMSYGADASRSPHRSSPRCSA